MSNSCEKNSHLQPSCPSSHASPSPDLASIAAMLQETAQALLSYSQSQQLPISTPAENDNVPDDQRSESPESIEAGYARGEFHDEIRCYRLPSYIVEQEYKLLRSHQQNEFSYVVEQVYDELATTIMLMRNFNMSAEFSIFDLHMIGENLSRPLGTLRIICSQLADFELLRKTTLPA